MNGTSNSHLRLLEETEGKVSAVSNIDELSRVELEQEVLSLRAKVANMRNVIGIDPISGLLTSNAFQERAAGEFRRSERYERDLTLLVITMVDLDKMTEKHGEDARDKYITSLAQMCESSCRLGSDIVGRLSENRFAVLLPEANMTACDHFKKRLKQEFDRTAVDWEGNTLRTTMKLSAAVLLEHDTSFKDLYQRTINQQVTPAAQTA